jgi:2-oxo-4-hydroxy-4-carboxy-5-ureidoimidazoline decarboxylase
MIQLTIEALNDADEETFVARLGDVYEHSPWVADAAWAERPFTSVENLHEAMRHAVEDASRERQLELLRAHPDLGDQTELTDASREEQADAGLDDLSPGLYETFQRLNDRYRQRFEFPFIMAVKGASPAEIRDAMEARLDNSRAEEFRTALDEVHEIARLRLDEWLST